MTDVTLLPPASVDVVVHTPVQISTILLPPAVIEVASNVGPPGPTAVSVDSGNTAVLGSDKLIFVPTPPPSGLDQATADALYVNINGDSMSGPLQIANLQAAAESLTVWGAAGQGVPLQTWRDVGGNVLMSVDSVGTVWVKRLGNTTGQVYFYDGNSDARMTAGVFEMGNRRLAYLLDAINPTDAVTLQQLQASIAAIPPPEAGGTTILDGDGPPAADLGELGDYYVDIDGALYGPKVEGTGSMYHLPSTPSEVATGNGAYTLSTRFQATSDLTISKARAWRTADDTTTTSRSIRVYTDAGSLLGSATTTETTNVDGWVEAVFPTPIGITAGTTFLVAADYPAKYAQTPVTPVMPAEASVLYLGSRYANAPGLPPETDGTNTNYIVDPYVEGSGGWNVVLRDYDQREADLRYVQTTGGKITLVDPLTNGLRVKGAPAQSAALLDLQNAAGSSRFKVGPDGTVNATIVRVPGIDLWNDGRIYMQAQTVNLGSDSGGLTTNKQGTTAAHLTRKDYVDARTPKITVGTTAPSSPAVGDIWVDTN